MREWVEEQVVAQAATGERMLPLRELLAYIVETATRNPHWQAS